MSMMESSNAKANILFLLGKKKDQGKLRGMKMNKVVEELTLEKALFKELVQPT